MFKKLQNDVKGICHSEGNSSLQSLKHELNDLKSTLIEDKKAYNIMIQEFSQAIAHQMSHVEALRKREADEGLRKQSESNIQQAKDTLEIEQNKLEDCHREIDMYRQQLEHSTRELDRLKSEAIEEKEHFDKKLKDNMTEKDKEKEEAVNKMILEHELEMETLRQELEMSEKVLDYQQQITVKRSVERN